MRRQAPASLSSSAARGVLWTGTGQVLRQLMQIGTSLVLVRMLVPEDFGLIGMAMSAALVLLLVVAGLLFVRDRRNNSDLAKLNDLQSQLDQSRQREAELRSTVNTERETSGDFVDELDRERQRREQIERELEQLRQKPAEAPTAPMIATAFLTPIGGRGGQGGTVPTVKIGSNTKRVALRLALPDDIGPDDLVSVDLNRRRVATGLKPRVSGNKKTINIAISASSFVQGKNQISVTDEQARNVGDYGITIER